MPPHGVATGRQFRVAPGLDGKPLAWFWKFWIVKQEIYACVRAMGHNAKISCHHSGQLHMRLGEQKRRVLARPLGMGLWLHLFELRFLIREGALKPPVEKPSNAYLFTPPPGSYAVLNLLVRRFSGGYDLPSHFDDAVPLWRSRLSNEHPVTLMVRALPIDDRAREDMARLQDIKMHVSELPAARYAEATSISFGPGGNVYVVMPVMPSAFTLEPPPPPKAESPDPSRDPGGGP